MKKSKILKLCITTLGTTTLVGGGSVFAITSCSNKSNSAQIYVTKPSVRALDSTTSSLTLTTELNDNVVSGVDYVIEPNYTSYIAKEGNIIKWKDGAPHPTQNITAVIDTMLDGKKITTVDIVLVAQTEIYSVQANADVLRQENDSTQIQTTLNAIVVTGVDYNFKNADDEDFATITNYSTGVGVIRFDSYDPNGDRRVTIQAKSSSGSVIGETTITLLAEVPPTPVDTFVITPDTTGYGAHTIHDDDGGNVSAFGVPDSFDLSELADAGATFFVQGEITHPIIIPVGFSCRLIGEPGSSISTSNYGIVIGNDTTQSIPTDQYNVDICGNNISAPDAILSTNTIQDAIITARRNTIHSSLGSTFENTIDFRGEIGSDAQVFIDHNSILAGATDDGSRCAFKFSDVNGTVGIDYNSISVDTLNSGDSILYGILFVGSIDGNAVSIANDTISCVGANYGNDVCGVDFINSVNAANVIIDNCTISVYNFDGTLTGVSFSAISDTSNVTITDSNVFAECTSPSSAPSYLDSIVFNGDIDTPARVEIKNTIISADVHGQVQGDVSYNYGINFKGVIQGTVNIDHDTISASASCVNYAISILNEASGAYIDITNNVVSSWTENSSEEVAAIIFGSESVSPKGINGMLTLNANLINAYTPSSRSESCVYFADSGATSFFQNSYIIVDNNKLVLKSDNLYSGNSGIEVQTSVDVNTNFAYNSQASNSFYSANSLDVRFEATGITQDNFFAASQEFNLEGTPTITWLDAQGRIFPLYVLNTNLTQGFDQTFLRNNADSSTNLFSKGIINDLISRCSL